MEGFDRHRRRLEIRLTEAERDDVVAGQVKHLANACGLNRKGSVAEVAHGKPRPVLHLNAITILEPWR